MLDKLVNHFATYLGITSDMRTESDGSYVLPVGDRVEVRVSQSIDDEIILYAFLGKFAPDKDVGQAYLQMMIGNLFGKETGGSGLGLDHEGIPVITKRLSKDVSNEDFLRHMEQFINFSEAWMDDLALSPPTNESSEENKEQG